MAEWRQLLTQKRQDELKAKCWNQLTSSDLRPGDGFATVLDPKAKRKARAHAQISLLVAQQGATDECDTALGVPPISRDRCI